MSYIFRPTAKQAREDSRIGGPLTSSVAPQRRSRSTSKETYISIARQDATRKSPARWSLLDTYNITEIGVAHCKHGKSINNFRIVFLQGAAGIQMRLPSRAKYVDIMDINIFIYDTPGCRCAPINHVAVILITFRIESVFPMLPLEKVQICMQRLLLYLSAIYSYTRTIAYTYNNMIL